MAGQAHRGSPGRDRSSHRGSSASVLAAASAAAPGSAPTSRASSTAPAAASPAPATLATYRALIRKGLSPEEATNLTAFLCGIPLGEAHWTLRQVNRLLFLRELHRTGRIGTDDGEAFAPH
jgi:hypothetical protein